MARALIVLSLCLACYLFGGVALYKQWPPFSQLIAAKHYLTGPGDPKQKPRNTLFESFPITADVVMVGDSLTREAEWGAMFPGVSIANRGIAGDTAADILQRMKPILDVQASAAFIMVGFNDMYVGYDVATVIDNYAQIVGRLKDRGVRVFIQSTLECSRSACGETLDKIRLLNVKLADLAEANGITFINVNEELADSDGLRAEFTYDGTHLLGAGYEKWRDVLSPHIAAARR